MADASSNSVASTVMPVVIDNDDGATACLIADALTVPDAMINVEPKSRSSAGVPSTK